MLDLAEHNRELIIEDWVVFAACALIFFTRFAVRVRTVGVRGLQGDDFWALMTLIFVSVDAWIGWYTQLIGQNLSVTPEIIHLLTPADIKVLEYGSQLELIAWHSYPSLIWSMKFTMLFFYKRLLFGPYHDRLVKYLMLLCGICYFICIMVVELGCRPYHANWQVVPIPPWQCTFRPQNTIVVSSLNVLTDAAILSIPLPMLWKLKLPWRKKIVIGMILSSGIFVIAAAIVRAVVTLSGAPTGYNINRWGVRETMLGVLTVNVPILRPLFKHAFWRPGPYDPSAAASSYFQDTDATKGIQLPNIPYQIERIELSSGHSDSKQPYCVGIRGPTSSLEEIIRNTGRNKEDGVVVCTTTVNVEQHDVDEVGSIAGDPRLPWTNISIRKK